MELEQILNALKELSGVERTKVQEALAGGVPSDENDAKAADAEADEKVETEAEKVAADIETDKADGAPSGQTGEDEKDLTDAVEADESADKAVSGEEAEAVADAPIPEMSKAGTVLPAEESTALTDEQGEDMPIDYRQIIDGLTAKNAALEAEISRLKTKVEGAFGLTGKPGAFTPVNPLYGNTDDIPRMRK
jgi:hypothetical protein